MKLTTLVLVLTAMLAGCGKSENYDKDPSKKKIAVIAKSTVNAYWKAVEAGARQAAKDANVEIVWNGPDSETNHSQQANMVDNLVNSGVAGVVIAPTNVDALVRPVETAVAKGVPVILIDSTLNSQRPVSVIATDNYSAGKQAADALAAAIGEKRPFGGKVLMLRYLEGSGSTEAREKGFADRIKELGFTLAESQYTKGGGSTTDANETADALLRRHTKEGVIQVDGIFASNQPTAIGMLRKLETLQGVKFDGSFVGFDAHEQLLAAIRAGRMAALVTQDPRTMGYLGVKTMIQHLNGEKIEAAISTATATVNKVNIDDPKIKQITLEGQ